MEAWVSSSGLHISHSVPSFFFLSLSSFRAISFPILKNILKSHSLSYNHDQIVEWHLRRRKRLRLRSYDSHSTTIRLDHCDLPYHRPGSSHRRTYLSRRCRLKITLSYSNCARRCCIWSRLMGTQLLSFLQIVDLSLSHLRVKCSKLRRTFLLSITLVTIHSLSYVYVRYEIHQDKTVL